MLNNITMIGVFGDQDSGKSVVAKFLHDYYGFNRLGLLDPVRFMVKEILLLDDKTEDEILNDSSYNDPADSEVYTIQMVKAYTLLTGKEPSTESVNRFIKLVYTRLPVNEMYRSAVYLIANEVRANNPDTLLTMLTARVASLCSQNLKASYRIVVEDIATVGEAVFIESFFGILVKVVMHNPLQKKKKSKAEGPTLAVQPMFTLYNMGNTDHLEIETAAVASVMNIEPVVKLPAGYKRRVPEVLHSLVKSKVLTEDSENFIFQFDDDLVMGV